MAVFTDHTALSLFSPTVAPHYHLLSLSPSPPSPDRYCEESLLEPVSTLLWAAPRLSSEIEELNKVRVHLSEQEL